MLLVLQSDVHVVMSNIAYSSRRCDKSEQNQTRTMFWSLVLLSVLTLAAGLLSDGCPEGTFFIIDRCCVDVHSKAGEQPVMCSVTDPWSSSVEPCPDDTYSMDGGWLSNRDVCSLKTRCDLRHMSYRHRGSRIQDATCKCIQGYYLTEEPHNCLRNPVCPIGYGQNNEGGCVDCSKVGRFSDRADRDQPCLEHTRCRLGQCVMSLGNSTADTVCGPCTNEESMSLIIPITSAQPPSSTSIAGSPASVTLNSSTEFIPTSVQFSSTTRILLHYVLPSCGAAAVGVCIACILLAIARKQRIVARNKNFAEELVRCRTDQNYRNSVLDYSKKVLGMHLGKKWKIFCRTLFEGFENRDTIPQNLEIDHGILGIQNIIQEMMILFKQEKFHDSNAVDVLIKALDYIGRGDMIEKILKDSSDIELGSEEMKVLNPAIRDMNQIEEEEKEEEEDIEAEDDEDAEEEEAEEGDGGVIRLESGKIIITVV